MYAIRSYYGWYDPRDNVRGTLLPQEITEFTNAGICVGVASVNLADDPMGSFNGFWTACSTYGSFSYLKYGPMRLFSQLAQDCPLKLGKVIWVVGHSGPETAEDSRTHFGIVITSYSIHYTKLYDTASGRSLMWKSWWKSRTKFGPGTIARASTPRSRAIWRCSA